MGVSIQFFLLLVVFAQATSTISGNHLSGAFEEDVVAIGTPHHRRLCGRPCSSTSAACCIRGSCGCVDTLGFQAGCQASCQPPQQPLTPTCPPPPPCAAPPEGCSYENPQLSEAGCLLGCGVLTCSPPPCPVLSPCPPPPSRCTYSTPERSVNGCRLNCGELECSAPEEVCPVLDCAAPPTGCTYGPRTYDNNGCAKDCGTLDCPFQFQFFCPVFGCAALSPGCTYGPPFPKDARGCATSCGTVTCQEEERPCPLFACAPPPAGCSYGPPFPKDARGCAINCGTETCQSCPVLQCRDLCAGVRCGWGKKCVARERKDWRLCPLCPHTVLCKPTSGGFLRGWWNRNP